MPFVDYRLMILLPFMVSSDSTLTTNVLMDLDYLIKRLNLSFSINVKFLNNWCFTKFNRNFKRHINFKKIKIRQKNCSQHYSFRIVLKFAPCAFCRLMILLPFVVSSDSTLTTNVPSNIYIQLQQYMDPNKRDDVFNP